MYHETNCTYDVGNRMKAAAGVTYTYDGDGKRVQKSNGKLYWYGMGSDPLDESDASGNLTDEYVFFGGKRIARRNVSSGNIFYYFADHLGTSRVIVQAGQTDRKSTRLNSSHRCISYAVFCLKKKRRKQN